MRPRAVGELHGSMRRTTVLSGLALSAVTVVAMWLVAEVALRVFFDGVRRIAILGDSMVAGLAVPEADTMCGVAEELLKADAGGAPRTEVMNFGVAASAPAQELVLYRGLVRRFAPDVVVLTFFYGNDLSDTLYEISDRYGRMYLEIDDAGGLRPRPYGESPAIVRWPTRSRVFA